MFLIMKYISSKKELPYIMKNIIGCVTVQGAFVFLYLFFCVLKNGIYLLKKFLHRIDMH